MQIAVCVGLDKDPIKGWCIAGVVPSGSMFSGGALWGGWIIWVLP